MVDEPKRFELEKGLYAVDTRSGHGYNPGGRISRVADHIHRAAEGASCTQIRHAMVELANIINERIS